MKINLSGNEIFFIDGDSRDVLIRCDTGTLWVTQPNDGRDHILYKGKTFNVTQKGRVMVVAMKDSVVKFLKLEPDSSKVLMNFFRPSPMLKLC